ncbi:ABC transporter ATP-binding protein [Arenibaculum sp.]|jgi:peptide/nickel transport system ATP-binding protein|uniref:ABC transporter ATP-binding protein n=1 Tax=Arenibaculum sp. TaxID=2865862 RepID=UPI002E131E96|nr:ABC transporter ATP-binding protein [Arenibaculum sp.]
MTAAVPEDGDAVLCVRGLTVRLPRGGDREFAVSGIDLTVRRKEVMCVVGESGSGKSVTSLAVMGLLPRGTLVPVAGSIRLEGEELTAASQRRLRELRGTRMGMIFQEPMTALNPVVRVGRQVEEVLKIHSRMGPAERRERVLEMFDQVHLPDPRRIHAAYPHELSGGQRQRIMIAIALVMEPRLLIADEPTTALDVTTQKQILALIDEIQQKHDTGVLFITHDFGVVAEIADRVTVMQDGRVVETGAVGDVLSRPREDYTRMLISAVPSLVPRAARRRSDRPLVLETHGLAKVYRTGGLFGKGGEIRAATDVNLTVRKGETLGVVGESGSGKSTVARCIVRLIDPTEGRILIDGADIAALSRGRLRERRQRFQIVFQDPYRSLNPRRTVGQSLIEGPTNFGVPKARALEEAKRLLELVGLEPGAVDRYPHQFSGGQRQRIAIARALAMKPDLLVADEAVSALDVSVQAQVLDLLEDIRDRFDLAVLFITHDLRVAAQICDDVAVMRKGEVVEYGTAADVLVAPRHEYTRALLASAPGRGWDFANFRPLPQPGCAPAEG